MIQRLEHPDPNGTIARIRSKLPRNCAIRLNRFCDHIIAWRIRGAPFTEIEKFLIEQGPEYRISVPTLWRNWKQGNVNVDIPYRVELQEEWGGTIDLDLSSELMGQVLIQRKRVDALVRAEVIKKSANPNYLDKRIRQEMETLHNMTRTLHGMMKDPLQVAEERLKARDRLNGAIAENLDEDAQKLLANMILNDELKVKPTSDGIDKSTQTPL